MDMSGPKCNNFSLVIETPPIYGSRRVQPSFHDHAFIFCDGLGFHLSLPFTPKGLKTLPLVTATAYLGSDFQFELHNWLGSL